MNHFRSGFECFDEILCFSRIFFIPSVRRWPVIIRPFSMSYSMEQLSAYKDGERPAPQADLESGQDTTSGFSVTVPPDSSQDGDLVAPTSVPAGPTGPVTCQQDLPSPASLPVLAGSKDPAGVLPPPDEPYDSFLLRMDRTIKDSTCRSRSLLLRCPFRNW